MSAFGGEADIRSPQKPAKREFANGQEQPIAVAEWFLSQAFQRT
jgi:hypothetical protein